MSKTTLANVDGFTPCIDSITQEFDITTSAVFGMVWRYCQMERRVCDASIETIAQKLNISYLTALRHVKILVGAKYLKDQTPDLRNHPHTYIDTGKANLEINITGVVYKNDRADESTLSKVNTDSSIKNIEPTLSNLYMKKDLKKDIKKESRGEKISDDNHKQRVEEALLRGMANHTGDLESGIDLVGYPEELYSIILETCQLWGFRTPMQKSKRAKWISDARELKHVCGELGLEPIRKERQRVIEFMEKNSGLSPYTYKDLGSLVGPVGGMAAQMRTNPLVSHGREKCTIILSDGRITEAQT